MHEVSVIYPIVQIADKIAKENNVEHIVSVNLIVGELHDFADVWIEHYYKQFCKGTTLEGSELHVKRIPMHFKCKNCGSELFYTNFEFAGVDLKCKDCGSKDMDMLEGRELQIESIEFIDPEKVKKQESENKL